MRKAASCLTAIAALLALGTCSRSPQQSIDFSSLHVYQPQEIEKIIESAGKIEIVGAPTVQKADGEKGTTIVTTSRTYRVYVSTGKDGHLQPAVPGGESAMMGARPGGPIIITTSCEMMCTPVTPGEPCNVSGCEPSDRCGCSQGSCGNNCTTDTACHKGLNAFGFGGAIIF